VRVAELWRYPVKSMRGTPLERAAIRGGGIEGDRLVQVMRPAGRVYTSRTHPGLLGLAATLDGDGPLIGGHAWDGPEAHELVGGALGTDEFELVAYDGPGPQRFDVLPLTVVTDGAIGAFGFDRRRLRSNIVLSGVAGLGERGFVGGRLVIGDVEIEVVKPRGRCVMTTFDPDTLEQDPGVLRHIVQDLDNMLALDCIALTDGEIAVGDEVRFEPGRAE
jgi:MOSC domain-containing protein